MLVFIVRRLLSIIPLLLLISIFTFVLLQYMGDPLSFYLQGNVTAADYERLSKQFGLDRPVYVRFFDWLLKTAQGDFGNSLVSGRKVTDLIRAHFPNTLLLMGTAFAMTLTLGVPLGVIAAVRRAKRADYVINTIAIVSFSAPTFWTGIMAIVFFSLWTRQNGLPHLPSGGMYDFVEGPTFTGILRHLILPASILSFSMLARYVRYVRNSLIEVLSQDYIRTARAKGVPERTVLYKHGLKNSLLPIVTIIAVDMPQLMGGALITEQVFSWPGMGRLMVDHAARADFPVLMGLLVFVAVLVMLLTVVADVVYTLVDPRVEYT
jgi:peptide/nickel transport system permease protein